VRFIVCSYPDRTAPTHATEPFNIPLSRVRQHPIAPLRRTAAGGTDLTQNNRCDAHPRATATAGPRVYERAPGHVNSGGPNRWTAPSACAMLTVCIVAGFLNVTQRESSMSATMNHVVGSLEELVAIYDAPLPRVLQKEVNALDEHCRAFIAASPFLLLATYSDANGADVSPRGDTAGWVEVADETTLLLPDRRGNNRIDSLRNIVLSPAVGLLFMVPGVNETLRVNGRAHLSTDPDLLARFVVSGKTPRTVIVVSVVEAFMQCARALVRSDLWNPAKHVERTELPSMGTILEAHTCGAFDAAEYDAQAPLIVPQTLY
jgi:PPOX class probable FMN-dependent enzyme